MTKTFQLCVSAAVLAGLVVTVPCSAAGKNRGATKAAVEAAKHEILKIILASKGPIGRSGLTPTANGGTAFHSDPEGTLQDMVKGGCFLNDQSLVWHMAKEAGNALETLIRFGISTVPIRAISRCVLPDDLLSVCRKKIVKSPNIALPIPLLSSPPIRAFSAITLGATYLKRTSISYTGAS